MRKLDLKKFTAAMTATAIAATGITPAISYDATPSTFINSVDSHVQAGDFAAAQQLVSKLKEMGVQFIVVAGKKMMLDDLGMLLSQDTVAATYMVRNLRVAVANDAVSFGMVERIITASDSTSISSGSSSSNDIFPISSMG